MKTRAQFAACCFVLAFALQCKVQAAPKVAFVMPQGADPITKLFFVSNGHQLSFFGRNLLPGNGIELHQDPNSNVIFNRLVFAPKGTFTGQITIDSFGGDGVCMPFTTPWLAPTGQTTFNFQLMSQTGSLRIGDIVLDNCTQVRGAAYASMIITESGGLQQTFEDEEFLVTAFGVESVPEGSAFWMFLAGLPVFGVLLRRRQVRTAAVKNRG